MKACGIITEYNPFHQGHLYHLQMAKKTAGADCMIAVMSGNFLQRGEPAIIDKFQRTRAALNAGVDLVIELPYLYAVQNSDFFSHGAVSILSQLQIDSLCFGSEIGSITPFINTFKLYQDKQELYQEFFHQYIETGISFPEANRKAFKEIGLSETNVDLTKPNNILGFSYVKEIMKNHNNITPFTIKRIHNNYHDSSLTGRLSSATSIRKELLINNFINDDIKQTLTEHSIASLENYKNEASIWHNWENYFPFLQYKVATMTPAELEKIHGVEEGLEFRLKKTAKTATSFEDWMKKIKTKRYTWTRLQRVFANLLVNCKKTEVEMLFQEEIYIRVLGMSKIGRTYLNQIKKQIDVPLFSQIQKNKSKLAKLEEKSSEAYYAVLNPEKRHKLIRQEYLPPVIL